MLFVDSLKCHEMKVMRKDRAMSKARLYLIKWIDCNYILCSPTEQEQNKDWTFQREYKFIINATQLLQHIRRRVERGCKRLKRLQVLFQSHQMLEMAISEKPSEITWPLVHGKLCRFHPSRNWEINAKTSEWR